MTRKPPPMLMWATINNASRISPAPENRQEAEELQTEIRPLTRRNPRRRSRPGVRAPRPQATAPPEVPHTSLEDPPVASSSRARSTASDNRPLPDAAISAIAASVSRTIEAARAASLSAPSSREPSPAVEHSNKRKLPDSISTGRKRQKRDEPSPSDRSDDDGPGEPSIDRPVADEDPSANNSEEEYYDATDVSDEFDALVAAAETAVRTAAEVSSPDDEQETVSDVAESSGDEGNSAKEGDSGAEESTDEVVGPDGDLTDNDNQRVPEEFLVASGNEVPSDAGEEEAEEEIEEEDVEEEIEEDAVEEIEEDAVEEVEEEDDVSGCRKDTYKGKEVFDVGSHVIPEPDIKCPSNNGRQTYVISCVVQTGNNCDNEQYVNVLVTNRTTFVQLIKVLHDFTGKDVRRLNKSYINDVWNDKKVLHSHMEKLTLWSQGIREYRSGLGCNFECGENDLRGN
ncbi:hypothetical protein B0I72DRAFT_142348 [Yarrowia lipolytica]|nr:hypothetical protein B0I72DRAFT_142348 [Yarrowia lipolytica]RDW37925.1 hypothetical protein B0I73DRAFT_134709 [Yarrowia lipolytica]RDW45430.1 hypothetical protein B0I74DRAFT_138799 [Yarrowia lipolytica]RDW52031.1 hypothetical protein B0I75DRAFT_138859 [Yarrowia lipolytica]